LSWEFYDKARTGIGSPLRSSTFGRTAKRWRGKLWNIYAMVSDDQSKPALRLIQSDADREDLYDWRLRKSAEVEQLRCGAY
jgi:hypothetical protein